MGISTNQQSVFFSGYLRLANHLFPMFTLLTSSIQSPQLWILTIEVPVSFLAFLIAPFGPPGICIIISNHQEPLTNVLFFCYQRNHEDGFRIYHDQFWNLLTIYNYIGIKYDPITMIIYYLYQSFIPNN